MKHKNLILTMLFIVALFCFPYCSDKKTPSPKVAEEYFLKKCVSYLEGGRLSDPQKNFRIDFEILKTDQTGEAYTLNFRSEIEHLKDDSLHPKGEKHFYEGDIVFIKEGESLIPQSINVFGHECLR